MWCLSECVIRPFHRPGYHHHWHLLLITLLNASFSHLLIFSSNTTQHNTTQHNTTQHNTSRHKTECSNTSFANKLIVLDEFDGHSNFAPFKNKEERHKHYPVVDNRAIWKFLFFKRSYVKRHDGIFQGFPHLKKPNVYPLTYSIMESYIQSPMSKRRDIDILCTLRGTKEMSTRLRVQKSVQKYIDAHPQELSTSVASQVRAVW